MKKVRSISVKGNCSFPSTLALERLSCTKASPLWWSRDYRIIRPDSLLSSLLSQHRSVYNRPRSQRLASLWSTSSWTAMPCSVFSTTSDRISPPRPCQTLQTWMTESLKSSWRKWKELYCSSRKKNTSNSMTFWPMMSSHTSKTLCWARLTASVRTC